MKNLTFLLILAAGLYSAQQNLLLKPLNENKLSPTERLSAALSKSYHATFYYVETLENLEQNFYIKLPTGKNISAVFQKKFDYTNKSSSAIYQITGEPNSQLVFSVYNKVVTGMYASAEGEKIIFQQVAASVLAVSLVNEQMLIDQDDPNDTVIPTIENFSNQNSLAHPTVCSGSVCPNTTVDVMVLFTPDAKTAYGGTAQSNSFIATAITNFNNSLQSSGVTNVTINLVHSGEIAYTESGNINTDLARLRTSGDGFLDDAQSLRTLYGADLVALVTATPTNTCGLGYVNTNPTNYSSSAAYTVTLFSCVVSNYSLAHEMGHNMGLNHDWFVNTSENPCSHHHGYVNRTAITLGTTSPTTARWRTIMAYNNECSDLGINCTRRNLWSNPNINYNTEPTGIAIGSPNPSYEAYGFARFACVVAGFTPTSNLSAKEAIAEDFSIYPNPVKDILTINTPNKENYTFSIITATGRNIMKTQSKRISVKGFASGMYYLAIYDEENQLIGTKKFLVN